MPDIDYQIVQLASMGAAMDAALAKRFRVLYLDGHDDVAGALREAPRATVAVTSVRKGLKREMIDALPGLRAVCSWGVGYETLDLAYARQRGIVASNTPEVLDDCVADLAWALLLTAARRTHVGDRYVKTGQWRSIGAFPLSTRVWGRRLGIVGMGRIGRAIAERGRGFGMDIRYHNRRPRTDTSHTFEPSLKALAEWSDFLVLACPGGAQTHHLIDAPILRALGPAGILVNIARGSVVDEAALVQALERGELGGAGLDVLEHEPAVPEPLRSMDQVALMPHVGSATHETRADMSRLVVDNAIAFLETGRLLTPIEDA
ncbi:2-hydroxyacid dehydrogenase [Bordetella genomosp. 9]|uniref:Hydroxyacid dehydrogenase n=1 Tax=Bordetella genomosp. 9 TaxID=1416803 RepID=A0A1W6Z3D5_9BORD|nr:2-hydroxyacid dehydrogenase [Bordetella genomosp. 9]ARP87862.1 hydroxyacid dehydrogenase [Bordetella genomosp. 9]